MAVGRGHIHGRTAIRRRRIGIGPRLNQVGDGLEVVLCHRERQGSKACLGRAVDISALADQQLDNVRMSLRRSPHQRRLSAPGFRGIQAGALGDQQFHRVSEAGSRCEHQRGFAVPAGGVGISTGFEQFLDQVGVRVRGGQGERRVPVVIAGIDVGAGRQEQLGGPMFLKMHRPGEGGRAVRLLRVHIDVVHQGGDGVMVAVSDGVDQAKVQGAGCKRQSGAAGEKNPKRADGSPCFTTPYTTAR